MSVEAAIDNTALKVGSIEGIKGAYGSQAYDDSVRAMIESVPDDPIALVVLAEGTVSAGNWQRVDYGIDVHVYANRQDLGAAYKALAVFPERFIEAWKTDRDLDRTVTESNLTGWSGPQQATVNGVDFLELVFHTRIIAVAGATYSV